MRPLCARRSRRKASARSAQGHHKTRPNVSPKWWTRRSLVLFPPPGTPQPPLLAAGTTTRSDGSPPDRLGRAPLGAAPELGVRVTDSCMSAPLRDCRANVVGQSVATILHGTSHSRRRPLLCRTRKRRNPRRTGGFSGGARYWDRTSDLFRVREARYRCANRAYTGCSIVRRGGDGIRTRVNGFAGRCLAARPRHRDVVRPTCRDAPSVSQTEIPPLERMTRLELATPTLARLCATNCATSAFRSRGLPRALVRHYPISARAQNEAPPARVSRHWFEAPLGIRYDR